MGRQLYFTLLTFFVVLQTSCECSTERKSSSLFKGHLMNNSEEFLVLFQDDIPIDTAYIDEDNNFEFRIETSKEGLYNFNVGNQIQYVYILAGDSLMMQANLLNVRQTISYSGISGNINNYITKMQYDNQDILFTVRRYHWYSPEKFKAKIDSIREIRLAQMNEFLNQNPFLNQNSHEIVRVSTLSLIDTQMEAYPFVHYNIANENVINQLSKDFFDYRKEINYNNKLLEYYPPYYAYMVIFVNNLAFLKNKNLLFGGVDVKKNNRFHFDKLKIIDSIFSKGNLRDNLYRNAVYFYLLNIQEEESSKEYFQLFEKYNKENKYKEELEQSLKGVLTLQRGNIPPNIELIDRNNNNVKLSQTFKPTINLYYFWAADHQMSSYVNKRIEQLQTLSPQTHFVGIDISLNKDAWLQYVKKNIPINSAQYHSVYFDDIYRKLLSRNMNVTILINEEGRIISAFENIFSPSIERFLLK